MKKLLVILMVFASIGLMGQARGVLRTVAADTINGDETVNFAVANLTGSYNSVAITAKCTQVGGTSDGTLTLYGSLDNTNWVFINGVGAGILTVSPKTSITGADLNQITITDGLIANWVVEGAPFRYYRLAGVGTAADSTLVNITYMLK